MYETTWDSHHPQYMDTAEDFFGADPKADFNRWCAVPFWQIEEATALSFGYDPRVVNESSLRDCEHPFAAEYDRRKDLASRAVTAGHLRSPPSPVQYIRWGESVGIKFQPELEALGKMRCAVAAVTSPSGLTKIVDTLSSLALAMTSDMYGFDPANPLAESYQEIADDLFSVEILVDAGSLKRSLKTGADLYEYRLEARQTLGKVVLGMAMKHHDHDPKALRSDGPVKVANLMTQTGKPVHVDTIRRRLAEAASGLGIEPISAKTIR